MANSEKNIRAFLAIEMPEDILRKISGLQEKLKREISGRISWTRPHGQHLTLKFFGDISTEDVKNICATVEQHTALEASLNLNIEKLGVFPDARRPRVLWCGTTGDVERLSALQKKMDVDLAKTGFPAQDRSFQAHLTLARIKDPRELTGISEALTKYGSFTAGGFVCRNLALFQSNLSAQGAVYTKLEMFSFSG
jgi:RNA 2',3'-cyclic 3'-phosphodiesterase